ncbi:MAG: anion permease [Lachnospiraceae bacterium]|nr:anion permease [Lachnospiraceae bacterium]
MSIGTIMIICFAAVILALIIGNKTKINAGIISLFFAYIIGVFVLGMKGNDLVGFWPTSIMVQMITILGFYGFANMNGTMRLLALKIIYPFRNKPAVMPFIILFATMFIGLIAGGAAVNGFMPTLAFSIAIAAGWDTGIFAAVCCLGAVVGSAWPMSQTGVMIVGALEEAGIANAESVGWTVGILSWVMIIVFEIILYFVFKGYKNKSVQMDEKPGAFNAQQKKTLAVIAVVVAVLVIPSIFNILMPGSWLGNLSKKVHLSLVCGSGMAVCAFLKLGDIDEVIKKRIPWSMILTICGIYVLVSIMTNQGASKYLAELVSANVPRALIIPLLTFFAGALSFFSSFFSTFPILFPLFPGIAASTGLSIPLMTLCCFFGSIATSISPFSNGGMNVLSQVPDQEVQKKQYTKQIYIAIGCLVYSIVCGFIFSIF